MVHTLPQPFQWVESTACVHSGCTSQAVDSNPEQQMQRMVHMLSLQVMMHMSPVDSSSTLSLCHCSM
jgi:hypothetical protein